MQHAGDNAQTRPTTTPRRSHFRGTAALLGAAPAQCQREAVAAPAEGGDDTELLAVCRQYMVDHALFWSKTLPDPESRLLMHKTHATLEWLEETRAWTPEGKMAKARAAHAALKEWEDEAEQAELTALSALSDIVGEG